MKRVICTKYRGFTQMGIVMAFTLLGTLAFKAQGASQSNGDTTKRALLEDEARRVLRQVAFVVMGSDRSSLLPESSGFSSENIRYRVNLGVSDGEVVWSDQEMVAMDTDRLIIYWMQNPDQPNGKKVVWSKLVSPFLEGEVANGVDDNDNGLIDEKGLSFVIDGNAVTIRLTLRMPSDHGDDLVQTVETTVTCSNLEDEY
ncbi:MAG: hypothetical protein GY930_07505 [bacterium]|nr:hypothetical protein [bacterium]